MSLPKPAEIASPKNANNFLVRGLSKQLKCKNNVDYSRLNKQEQADVKQRFIDKHIEKIKESDAILIVNYSKNGIEGYIGAHTFLEMAFTYILQKKIYILNNVPNQSNTVEIEGLKPIILRGNLNFLKDYPQM